MIQQYNITTGKYAILVFITDIHYIFVGNIRIDLIITLVTPYNKLVIRPILQVYLTFKGSTCRIRDQTNITMRKNKNFPGRD